MMIHMMKNDLYDSSFIIKIIIIIKYHNNHYSQRSDYNLEAVRISADVLFFTFNFSLFTYLAYGVMMIHMMKNDLYDSSFNFNPTT